MTTIYIATDTSGLWKWKENTDHPGQPHLLRLAMLRDDDDTRPLSTLVKLPQGVVIEPGAAYAHGITSDIAARATAEAGDVLDDLMPTILAADAIVGFGADFHRKVLEATMHRTGHLVPEWRKQWRCAMNAAAEVMRLELISQGQWKTPSFAAAYRHFTGEGFTGGTDPTTGGLDKVRAVRRVWEAATRGVPA